MINIFIRKGHNPTTGEPFYYLQYSRRGVTEITEIAEDMAEHSTFSVGEIAGIMLDVPKRIMRELADGNDVHIPGFGTFKTKINSKAAATPEELSTRSISLEVVYEPELTLEHRLTEKAKYQIVKYKKK